MLNITWPFSLTFTLTELFMYFIIFFLTWLLYKIVISPKLSPLQKIPGFRGSFLMGVHHLKYEGESPGEKILRLSQELNRQVFRIHMFLGIPAVAVADPDVYKHITVTKNSNYPKPHLAYMALMEIFGNGLVSMNGKQHSVMRNLCNGAFKANPLRAMFGKINKHSSILVDHWLEKIGDGSEVQITVSEALEYSTLDTITSVAFDYQASSLSNPTSDVNSAFKNLLCHVNVSLQHFIPYHRLIPTEANHKFNKAKKIVDDLVYSMIDKKKDGMKMIEDTEGIDDLLTLLLFAHDDDGRKMSRQEIRDQVVTFMFAGAETTSTTLTWCLYALACNPEVQEKARKEIFSVLENPGTSLNVDHMNEMPYLLCIIKETLRLHTPVPETVRIAEKDDILDGWHIPAGTMVILYLAGIHMNPKYWKDPKKFIPERFLNEDKMKPFTFIPFTSGQRMCIGYKFALMEMRIFLAHLLRKFRFDLIPGIDVINISKMMTAQADPPIKLKLTKL